MTSVRVGANISVILACCAYVSAYVLTGTGTKGTSQYSKDIENRLTFLAKFLHQINSVKDTVQLPKDVASLSDSARSSMDVASKTDNIKPKMGILSHIDNTKSPMRVVTHTDGVESPTAASETDTEKSYIETSFKAIEEMIRILEMEDAPKKHNIAVEKKDYSILPPASEWCRLMGIRHCRGSHS
ncbi:uncharacterized protein LOC123542391 [Mercenaria mercenaria]|uniref:uncharacterized protein LOC123542391 n=1 Tax=Mercenaria mercenaria TaxID=6596 RepID=UPI00234EBEA2|nr:uncharacterized protein LOC123542391 [Mercenaria mercenaria]